jgi:hypothetical protein
MLLTLTLIVVSVVATMIGSKAQRRRRLEASAGLRPSRGTAEVVASVLLVLVALTMFFQGIHILSGGCGYSSPRVDEPPAVAASPPREAAPPPPKDDWGPSIESACFHKIEPCEIEGDFDGDGKPDQARLLVDSSQVKETGDTLNIVDEGQDLLDTPESQWRTHQVKIMTGDQRYGVGIRYADGRREVIAAGVKAPLLGDDLDWLRGWRRHARTAPLPRTMKARPTLTGDGLILEGEEARYLGAWSAKAARLAWYRLPKR